MDAYFPTNASLKIHFFYFFLNFGGFEQWKKAYSAYLRHEDNLENRGSFPVEFQELYYIPIKSTPKYNNFIVESHGHNALFIKK